jgi:hypothetical protein
MIHENEVVMLALGIAVFFFAMVNRTHLERIPQWNLLLLAYCSFLAGWVMTVCEGFLFPATLNVLEHLCYACGTVTMAAWCWKTLSAEAGEGK